MHSSVLLRKFRRASALGYLVGALPVSSGGGFGSKAELGVGAGSFAPHGGEYAEVAVDVVGTSMLVLPGWVRKTRPTYWTMLPLKGVREEKCVQLGQS